MKRKNHQTIKGPKLFINFNLSGCHDSIFIMVVRRMSTIGLFVVYIKDDSSFIQVYKSTMSDDV